MSRKPTPRQKAAAVNLVENGGSMGSALKKAGYSKAVINNPSKVTESVGFKQALAKYEIDPDLVSFVMRDGLQATRESRQGDERADYAVRHKYMESAMRALGLQGADNGTTNNYLNLIGTIQVEPNDPRDVEKLNRITEIMMEQ